MKNHKFDGWLLVSNEGYDINVDYLLGVKTHGRIYIFIPDEGIPNIIAINYEATMIKNHLEKEKIAVNVINFNKMEELYKIIPPLIKNKTIAVNYGENLFSSFKGTPYANTMAAGELVHLQKINPTTRFVSSASILYELRGVKSDSEIHDFKEVISITEEILDEIPNWVKIGMTEMEVKMTLEQMYLKNGVRLSFPSIVASQENSANVHHITSTKKIGKGPLLIDSGFKKSQMCSDITRTFWVGSEPSNNFESAYSCLYEAKQISFKFMKAGVPLQRPEAVIRKVLKKNGWKPEKYFIHGLGHPIGFEAHDIGIRPTMNVPKKIVYKNGEVFTNEPGLYIPNRWGIRLEDIVVIREHQAEILTHTPIEIIRI